MHGDLGRSLEIVLFGGLGIVFIFVGILIVVLSKKDKNESFIGAIVFILLGLVSLIFSTTIS